ncbi:hypothetical protein BDW69DRAFT_37651 [Aspergillus filifer]
MTITTTVTTSEQPGTTVSRASTIMQMIPQWLRTYFKTWNPNTKNGKEPPTPQSKQQQPQPQQQLTQRIPTQSPQQTAISGMKAGATPSKSTTSSTGPKKTAATRCTTKKTGWEWTDATDDSYAKVSFNLPFFIAEGCVEHAIKSAGGPELVYDGQPLNWKRKARIVAEERTIRAPEGAKHIVISEEKKEEARGAWGTNFTEPLKKAAHPVYVPMNWEKWHAEHDATSPVVSASVTGSA